MKYVFERRRLYVKQKHFTVKFLKINWNCFEHFKIHFWVFWNFPSGHSKKKKITTGLFYSECSITS